MTNIGDLIQGNEVNKNTNSTPRIEAKNVANSIEVNARIKQFSDNAMDPIRLAMVRVILWQLSQQESKDKRSQKILQIHIWVKSLPLSTRLIVMAN